jgi:fermentation-respiration switch protein FrsA (DUF1100 family)
LLEIHTEDEHQLLGWYRRAQGRGLVLFTHGNAETVVDRVGLQDMLVSSGVDFLTFAYRGYPGSPGEPSEAGLRLDVLAAWRYATERLGFSAERIIVHGKSLGGGVAGLLCAEVQPAALVLESTFLSVVELVRDRAPQPRVASRVTEAFDTASRAPMIRCPVLVLHGDRDRVIPVRHGRELWQKFANASYVELAGAAHGESLTVVEPRARRAYLELIERQLG